MYQRLVRCIIFRRHCSSHTCIKEPFKLPLNSSVLSIKLTSCYFLWKHFLHLCDASIFPFGKYKHYYHNHASSINDTCERGKKAT